MKEEERASIPLAITLDMLKESLRTLPIEDLRAVRKTIDEVLQEYEQEGEA